MPTSLFVGRERELDSLLSVFARAALVGHGQVIFISGEPGSGKTTLLREFARRAQSSDRDLVVAVGDCNAHTGVGDPYLPFREILGMLAGDFEGKLAQGAITSDNADRLKGLIGFSGQALVDVGPALINLFVPGAELAGQAARFMAGKAGWLKQMERLSAQNREVSAGSLDQNRLCEQYTNVLKALAVKRPLMLVVDDLQWVDPASANMLFHLARRIGDSSLLLVGAYRPEEVALGRGGERHPLEKVIAECKRYFGEVGLDLNQAAEVEGRQFVDLVLDSEPNCLDSVFREALYQHTGGNPLFVIELLRSMQERGNVHKDAHGRWVAGATLDWATLPARVEGVIEERIGRLEHELRDILAVASVEGENFTAQVVARVQEVRERHLLHRLSEQLEKQHRLVREYGEVRVSHNILSQYRFAHALFHRYFYNSLGAGERRLLHREVGRLLEDLYAGATEEVAVQLARHFVEAGEDDKAAEYLVMAGDRARALYANHEALEHYRRGLALLETADFPAKQDLACRFNEGQGDVLELAGQHEEALKAYRAALLHTRSGDCLTGARLYRKVGNTLQVQRRTEEALHALEAAEAALGPESTCASAEWWRERLQTYLDRMFLIYYLRADPVELAHLAERARPQLQQYGTPTQRGQFYQRLVLTAYRRDRYVVSEETLADGRSALAAVRETGSLSEVGFAQFMLGFSHLWRGELSQAVANLSDALKLAERAGDLTLQSRCLTYLAVSYRKGRQVDQTRDLTSRAMSAAKAGDMTEYIASAEGNHAWVAWQEGHLADALEFGHAALELFLKVPTAPTQWLARWPLLAVALTKGSTEEAVEHSRAMLLPTQMRLPDNLTAAMSEAMKAWDAGESATAHTLLENALPLARESGYL